MTDAVTAAPDTKFARAERPTMYFIGVTTGKSSIMKVFPRWAEYWGLGDVVIRGIDCQQHDQAAMDVFRHRSASEMKMSSVTASRNTSKPEKQCRLPIAASRP